MEEDPRNIDKSSRVDNYRKQLINYFTQCATYTSAVTKNMTFEVCFCTYKCKADLVVSAVEHP